MLRDESPRDVTGPRDAIDAAFVVEDRAGFPAVAVAVAAVPRGHSADPSASGSRARVAFPLIAAGPPPIPPAPAPLAFETVVPFIGVRVDFALAPFARPTRPSLRASSIAETPWIARAR
jgi:hypothetical protein